MAKGIEAVGNVSVGKYNIVGTKVKMEDLSEIHDFNSFQGEGTVWIGKGAVVSSYCLLMTEMRTAYGLMNELAPKEECDIRSGDIFIEEGAYVGPHVTICPGVRIGRHSVIGAYCYVTKDVSPCTIFRYKSKPIICDRLSKKAYEEEEII